MKMGKHSKKKQQQSGSGKAVLVTFYVVRPRRNKDGGGESAASSSSRQIHRHHHSVHHHHHHHLHHHLHGRSHETPRRGADRRADLLEYSRQLRATSATTVAHPKPPLPPRRDIKPVSAVRHDDHPAAGDDRRLVSQRRLERAASLQEVRYRCLGYGGDWNWKKVLKLVLPCQTNNTDQQSSTRSKKRRDSVNSDTKNNIKQAKAWPAAAQLRDYGITTSSSDDEFLHTDNFFPDLSDFFDNLNMGDNDAAMKQINSSSVAAATRPPLFDGMHYKRWRTKAVLWFTNLGCFSATNARPEGPLSAEEQEKFEKVDAMFKAALFSILGDNIVDPYMAFDHGKDAWDALEAKFGVSDAGTELYVMEQYYDYRMTDERSVVEQAHEIQSLAKELEQFKCTLPDKFVAGGIIAKLPPSWRNFATSLKHKRQEFSASDLIGSLHVEEKARAKDTRARSFEGGCKDLLRADGKRLTCFVRGVGTVMAFTTLGIQGYLRVIVMQIGYLMLMRLRPQVVICLHLEVALSCKQTIITRFWGALRRDYGITTSSSDDEFLHTDNFFPDLSDFFDNLNMGDNDAAMNGDSSPRPPVFRTEAERRKFNRSEGARKSSARRWTNWGSRPPRKARKIREQRRRGVLLRRVEPPPRPPVYDSSEEEQTVIARESTFSAGDYVHGSDEEDAVIA
ncbi:hypothetical protein QYE76_046178 [Lolium multiflorum]|uniref:Uncharacterized protein n=1 Tax=Lolium multiflorum TaxID=4521 RepID=A0AAD8TMH0_LOLMU|nr:hypothetical protein QYE76_046178 [Lolium multiflorum]